MFTEKSYQEAYSPLANYGGNDAFVKGKIYSLQNGGNAYDYSKNLSAYQRAYNASKANDNDNILTGIKDFFLGRDIEKQRADAADEFLKYSGNPYEFRSDLYSQNEKNLKSNIDYDKGIYFEGGLLGNFLAPWTQTGGTIARLGQGVIDNDWEGWNRRDHASDAAAAAQVALQTATGMYGGGAPTSALSAIGKDAAIGGSSSLLRYLQDSGKDADFGQAALNTGIGAAIGGLFGGTTYGLKKAASNAIKNRMGDYIVDPTDMTEESVGAYQDVLKKEASRILNNKAEYADDVVNALENDINKGTYAASKAANTASKARFGVGNDFVSMPRSGITSYDPSIAANTTKNVTFSPETIQLLNRELQSDLQLDPMDYISLTGANVIDSTSAAARPYYRDFGVSTSGIGRTAQGITDALSGMKGKATGTINNLLNTKAGSAIANTGKKILSTKAGKLGATIGAGYGISKLLSGGKGSETENNTVQQLTPEEINEIYNYVYNRRK